MPNCTLPTDIEAAIEEYGIAAEQFGGQIWARPGDGDAVVQARRALKAAIRGHLPVEKPRVRVPYRREPEVQIVDRIGGSFTARAPAGDPVWGPMSVRRDAPPPDVGGVTVRPCGA